MMWKSLVRTCLGLVVMVAAQGAVPTGVRAQQATATALDDRTEKALTAVAGAGQMQPRAFEYLGTVILTAG